MNTPDSRRRAVSGAPGESVDASSLSGGQRQAWEAALDYYQRQLASRDLVFDDSMIAITNKLAGLENAPSVQDRGLERDLVTVLERAAPAYRAAWWPRHDRANRDWVAMIDVLLQQYGATVSSQIAGAYRTAWPVQPFRVDVCAYANWAGAYTTEKPPRITVSSADEGGKGTQGLETLFHESMHVLEPPLVAALRREAGEQGKSLPAQFSHAIIFFTAGEITRHAVPDHVPYAMKNGIWSRPPFGSYLAILEAGWQPYLEGKSSFDVALKRLVTAL